jgi:hypothetical protein
MLTVGLFWNNTLIRGLEYATLYNWFLTIGMGISILKILDMFLD